MNQHKERSPWAWIPTLYFFQGVPYSIVMVTSGLIYKTMGISIASFAFWTSVLYLPWAIKPLWSPYIDVVSTKRNWVVWTQLLLGAAFIAAGHGDAALFLLPCQPCCIRHHCNFISEPRYCSRRFLHVCTRPA